MDEALLLNHIVRLGRQTAGQRLAHLLLELGERLEMAGMGACDQYRLPLTQEILSEALGLSLVHMNRTIQQLRADGAIRLQGGMVTILERERLCLMADFSPHQCKRQRASRPPRELSKPFRQPSNNP